jgi:hypothetical protein
MEGNCLLQGEVSEAVCSARRDGDTNASQTLFQHFKGSAYNFHLVIPPKESIQEKMQNIAFHLAVTRSLPELGQGNKSRKEPLYVTTSSRFHSRPKVSLSFEKEQKWCRIERMNVCGKKNESVED